MRDEMSYTKAMQPTVKSNQSLDTTTRWEITRGAVCGQQRRRLNQPVGLSLYAALPRLLESGVSDFAPEYSTMAQLCACSRLEFTSQSQQ